MANASSLESSVLVLNRSYVAIHVVSVKRAFGLLCKSLAEVIHVGEDQSYQAYDFWTWKEFSELKAQIGEKEDADWVRTVSFEIMAPRVVRLLVYDRLPKRVVRFNRRNIFARDGNRCQYCGRKLPSSELSIDHVVPRSRGGQTVWNNVVCACVECNKRKGGRTPKEAGMRLVHKPVRPKRSPVIMLKLRLSKYETWKHFLDEAYWSVELQQ